MLLKSQVSIIPCPSYSQSEVDQAIQSLGLIDKIVKPGQRVLLKVNALMAAEPGRHISTHPAIVKAVIGEVKKYGGLPVIGDSPGNPSASFLRTAAACGFDRLGAELLPFQDAGLVEFVGKISNKKIKIAKAVLNFDVIINLPKLKTHGWTLMTGAIKNLFGCVPGFHKSQYHQQAPQPQEFSKILVDILSIVKPQLHIMDAVIGMEGAGPSAGQPRQLGAIIASTDPVALDAVAATLIGYKPFEILPTRIAHENNLGIGNLENIEILGSSLETFVKKDWKHSSSTFDLTKNLPNWLVKFIQPILNKYLRVDPVINQAKCTQCQVCVRSCPAKTISIQGNQIIINPGNCIMCYCCHELCKYEAIDLRPTWLAKRLVSP